MSDNYHTIASVLGVRILEHDDESVRVEAPGGHEFRDGFGGGGHEITLVADRAAEFLSMEGQIIRCDCVICESVRRTVVLRDEAWDAIKGLVNICGGDFGKVRGGAALQRFNRVQSFVDKLWARGGAE